MSLMAKDFEKVNLLDGVPRRFNLEAGGSFEAQIITLEPNNPFSLTLREASEGFLLPFNGKAHTIIREDDRSREYELVPEDLVYLRKGHSMPLLTASSGAEFRAFLVTFNNPKVGETQPGVFGLLLPGRTEKTADWVGNWVPGMKESVVHIGREGEKTISPDNLAAESAFHYHERMVEAFFTGTGWTSVTVNGERRMERVLLGSGDLIVFRPGTPHALGRRRKLVTGTEVDKTYFGVYKGATLKIPTNLDTPVDRNDKIIEG